MIVQLDQEGNVIAEFATITEAYRATGAEATNIRKVIKGIRNLAKGFRWEERFTEIEEDPGCENIRGENLNPECLDEDGFGREDKSWTERGDNATFTGTALGEDLRTLEDVLSRCEVDLTVWEVKSHTLKHWTTAMKVKVLVDSVTGRQWKEGVPFKGSPVSTHKDVLVTNTSWKVEFAHRSDYREKLVEMLLEKIAPTYLEVGPRQKRGAKYAVEFAIFDHHLGKDGFDPNTMQPLWSIDQAMNEYQKVIQFGLSHLDLDKVSEFWLPTGNDLLHTDSYLGTTTSGTKIASDLFWLTLFRYGKEAVSLAIQTLRQYAPVKVMFIPGNHDHNGILALSEVIKGTFTGSDVETFCSGRGREWMKYGKNLLGWHHGDKCDPRKAHTAMIGDVPDLIELNQYRAMHVGHTHRSAKWETVSLNTLTEEFGLVYEICPSLTPTDKWHDQNLYIGNMRRSKIFVYDYDRGLEAEYIYNIQK